MGLDIRSIIYPLVLIICFPVILIAALFSKKNFAESVNSNLEKLTKIFFKEDDKNSSSKNKKNNYQKKD